MMSPMPHNHREDVLEVSILDTINVPQRKDGSARQPFFSALIPSTEQRWQQQQQQQISSSSSSSTSSSVLNQTFFFSVADRQERSVKIALWDRKGNGTDNEHQKLLGECTIPLYYVGWQWVDAKLKLKAADGAQPSKYAASYLRTRMRFTRDSRSGKSVDLQPVEELEEASPKATPERKKFWRHTRDLGKRSPLIDRNPKQNEFLMSQDIRTVGGPEYADNMDKPNRSARTEMLLSQPVRTISINADDSSSSSSSDSSSGGASSDEGDDARPPAKQGSGLSRRLSRDITKLRQLLTLTDSHQAQPLTNTRSLSPKGSQGGRKFWTIGRQSEASLEVTQSAEELKPVRDSVTSIDWHNGAHARTLSDGDMPSLEPRKGSSRKKNKKTKAVKKKKKEKKEGSEEQDESGGKDRSLSGSNIIKKLKKRTKKTKSQSQSHQKVEDKEEEGWERESSGGEQQTHNHKRETSQDDESGVVLAVIEEDEEVSVKDGDVSSEFEAVVSTTSSTATASSSGELSPTPSEELKDDQAEVLKLTKKKRKEDKRKSKSKSGSSTTLPVTAADKARSKSKSKKATKDTTPTKAGHNNKSSLATP